MEAKDNGLNLDFGFAFDDVNFSDRVLKIVIEHDDKIECSSMQEKGENATKDNKLFCNIGVRTIHISSPVLAAKSPFFLRLFSNGMKESKERTATLHIHSSEEVALMDLLNFMYYNTLSSATSSSLVDVLMVANKFQVSSCIKYCINLLCNLPMTCELALQYLHLPSTVMMPDEVQPLTDAANKYLAHCCQNFTMFEEDIIKLPIAGIEAILSNDHLQVISENAVYQFVLKWARKHYPMIDERRDITARLSSLIRFEYMSVKKLKEMLTCNDFDPAYASKVVLETLILKAESTLLHTYYAPKRYTLRPVKTLENRFPHPNCIVYLELRKEECENLFPHKLHTEWFRVGQKFFLLQLSRSGDSDSDSFGLFLGTYMKQPSTCTVDVEVSVRTKPTGRFMSIQGFLNYTFHDGRFHGLPNLFQVPWSQFLAPYSIYFINDVLYLKIELALYPN